MDVGTYYTHINADCDEDAIKLSDEKLKGRSGELTHGAWKEKRIVRRWIQM